MATYVASKNLTDHLQSIVAQREVDLLFGAIEAGPLTFARLHSANFSADLLKNLLSNDIYSRGGITKVKIRGDDQIYAQWTAINASVCPVVSSRRYEYPDSLVSFLIEIELDSCFRPQEADLVARANRVTFLFVNALFLSLIGLIIVPILVSVRRAQRSIANLSSGSGAIGDIYFKPIQDLLSLATKGIELEKAHAELTVAKQVAHDIRSPLAAIEVVTACVRPGIDQEERMLLQQASSRIRQIINTLLTVNSREKLSSTYSVENLDAPTMVYVATIVDPIVFEKNILRGGAGISVAYEASAFAAIVRVKVLELKRALSNILDNSIEATEKEKKIFVIVSVDQGRLMVEVVDEGVGIQDQDFKLVGVKGYSKGKVSGSGLGVYYSKSVLEKAGGSIEFSKNFPSGTRVKVVLPLVVGFDVFAPPVNPNKFKSIVIIDDQEVVHLAWKNALGPHCSKALFFYSPQEAGHIFDSLDLDTLILIDHDFGIGQPTGLDTVIRLGMASCSILVTGHYEDLNVVAAAKSNGVKIVPKEMIRSFFTNDSV